MTNRKKSKTSINVGVDVGKQFLDVCIYEKALHWQEENNARGIQCLLKRLAHYHVERLVMEVIVTNGVRESRQIAGQSIQPSSEPGGALPFPRAEVRA